MADDDETSELAGTVLVSCGPFQGKLWMSKFFCPGIHQKCIEVDGEMMTPKSFCIIGDKQKLKDWKNAIRINGRSVRKLMDSNEFDFFKHDEICTGRCMSRHYGPSKYDTKIETLQQKNSESVKWSNLMPSTDEFEHKPFKLEGAGYSVLRDYQGNSPEPEMGKPKRRKMSHVVFPGMDLEEVHQLNVDSVTVKKEMCSDEESLNSDMHISKPSKLVSEAEVSSVYLPQYNFSEALNSDVNMHSGIEGYGQNGTSRSRRKNPVPQQVSENGSMQSKREFKVNGNTKRDLQVDANQSKIVNLVAEFPDTEALLEDSVAFWQGIQDMGLLDDVIRDARHALDNIKCEMTQRGINETDARKLSDVVSSLGLSTKIKWRMADHKTRTESETEKLLQELQELRKKVAESEVKQQVLKRKSDCLDSLLEKALPKRAAIQANAAASSPVAKTTNTTVRVSSPTLTDASNDGSSHEATTSTATITTTPPTVTSNPVANETNDAIKSDTPPTATSNPVANETNDAIESDNEVHESSGEDTDDTVLT